MATSGTVADPVSITGVDEGGYLKGANADRIFKTHVVEIAEDPECCAPVRHGRVGTVRAGEADSGLNVGTGDGDPQETAYQGHIRLGVGVQWRRILCIRARQTARRITWSEDRCRGGLVKFFRELFDVVLLAKSDEGSCLLYTSPSPRDRQKSRMPSSA